MRSEATTLCERESAMPCDFQWDSSTDQIFNCEEDKILSGPPEDFNKSPGKTFTMDAPGQTLTLKNVGHSSRTTERVLYGTTWYGSDPNAPAATPTIDVKRGTFIYDAGDLGATLHLGNFQDSNFILMTLSVENDATFLIRGNAGPVNSEGVKITSGDVNIGIYDQGLLDVSCGAFILGYTLGERNEHTVDIGITGMARMSIVADGAYGLNSATINVNSSPPAGDYSLKMVCPLDSPSSEYNALLGPGAVNFSAASRGLFNSQSIGFQDVRIMAADTAVCTFQTNFVTAVGSPQFILAPRSAKMQFESWSNGALPFDFRNKEYPKKLFNFTTSPDSPNNSEFVIRVSDGFIGNELVNKGLFAVDGELLTDSSRLKTQGELLDGYYAMTYRLKDGR
jgi:hypothetical protein